MREPRGQTEGAWTLSSLGATGTQAPLGAEAHPEVLPQSPPSLAPQPRVLAPPHWHWGEEGSLLHRGSDGAESMPSPQERGEGQGDRMALQLARGPKAACCPPALPTSPPCKLPGCPRGHRKGSRGPELPSRGASGTAPGRGPRRPPLCFAPRGLAGGTRLPLPRVKGAPVARPAAGRWDFSAAAGRPTLAPAGPGAASDADRGSRSPRRAPRVWNVAFCRSGANEGEDWFSGEQAAGTWGSGHYPDAEGHRADDTSSQDVETQADFSGSPGRAPEWW